MAATKTSDETAASALTGAELIRGVQGGANVKATVEQFRDYGIKSGVPFAAMAALAVNVAIPGNSYSATGDVTFTYSNATPAEGTSTFLRIETDGTARTITIPSTWSLARNGAITSLLVPANSILQVKLQYVGSQWEIIGDPPVTTGTGSFVQGNNPTLKAPKYTQAAISALEIDWDAADILYKTLGADSEFTFANAADGKQVVVAVTGASTYTVTWPVGVAWTGGTPPVQTVDATDVYTFIQINGVIYGSAIQDFS